MYFFMEIFGFIGNVYSYVYFLFVRSLAKTKILIDEEYPEEKRLSTIDTIVGLIPILDMVVN